MQTPYFSLPSLPWDRFAEDENRFRVIISVTMVVFIVLSGVIATFDLPEKPRLQTEVIPPRVAKLVMEKRLPPPPPKVEEKKPELKPEPEKIPEKKPVPEKPKVETPPEPKPVVKPTPKPVEKPKVTVKTQEQLQAERKDQAKQEAVKAVAVFDSLADLRDPATDVNAALATSQQALGANDTAGMAPATQRSLIGKMAAGGSGGVAVAKASSGGGGAGTVGGTGKLAGTQTTAVSSKIAQIAPPKPASAGASGKTRRTSEQVQVVFDRYKSQIYTLYQRALREDPALEGTLLLKLEIQPNGTVSACSVVSSELGNPDLERKIVVRVKQLNFGNANVEVWRGNFPIKFFPS